MPSASEFKALLEEARDRLNDIKGILDTKLETLRVRLETVNSSVQQVNGTLAAGFNDLLTQAAYTNQALYHNAQQNDTMICILEHISQNTCALLNEASAQTRLQRSMETSLAALADLYATVHADAALAREKSEKLRAQIEACCPPPPIPPSCAYERCPVPGELPKPPRGRESRPIG